MPSNVIDKPSMTWITFGLSTRSLSIPLSTLSLLQVRMGRCRFGTIRSRNDLGNIQGSGEVWRLLLSTAMEVGSLLGLVVHGMKERLGIRLIQ